MNGYEFKREIERIFKVARNMYPNVTDGMLDANGAIYYMYTFMKPIMQCSQLINLQRKWRTSKQGILQR